MNWTTWFGKKVAHVFLVEDPWSQCLVNGCGSLQSMFHNVIFMYIKGRWVLWVLIWNLLVLHAFWFNSIILKHEMWRKLPQFLIIVHNVNNANNNVPLFHIYIFFVFFFFCNLCWVQQVNDLIDHLSKYILIVINYFVYGLFLGDFIVYMCDPWI